MQKDTPTILPDATPTETITFKEQIQVDVNNVFFNLHEFVDKHLIDGEEMDVLIDQNELIEREKKSNQNMNGVYLNQTLIYVKQSQFGNRPKLGSRMQLDKKNYVVLDCTEEMGVYAITLEAHRG